MWKSSKQIKILHDFSWVQMRQGESNLSWITHQLNCVIYQFVVPSLKWETKNSEMKTLHS